MKPILNPALALCLVPTLATDFPVTTPADGGPGSLREAIALANASPGPDTIQLPADLYLLTGGVLTVTDPAGLVLTGAGADLTTVDAQGLASAFQVDPGAMATVAAITVTNGVSAVSFVGGNFNVDGHLTLEDCEVLGGQATFGGGVRVTGGAGSVTVRRCTFSGNQGFGSAIESQQGSIHVSNSTFSGNLGSGGVIRLSNAASMTVQNSTVVDNGSGLVLAGGGASGSLFSTIAWNNVGGDTSETGFGWGPWSDGGFNLIGDPNGTLFPAPTNRIGLDPLLEGLAYQGGPTRTCLPRGTSPAREGGSNAVGLTTDQRGPGFPRSRGALTDIGAVEGRRRARATPHVPAPTAW